ncbi:MAG: hypothetical protein U9P12_05550 [Verrucomicrobiota bacterium]|nr:hypothetical protein [Verrucomicrobiota bacterium]
MIRLKYILLVLLLCGSWAVKGRVFRSVGVRDGRLNTVGLPWQLAYRTTMDVNGERNDLHVYSAHSNEPVVEQLKDRFERQGAAVVVSQTRDGAQGVARFGDREVRILVLSPGSRPNQMVFLFYPEPGKAQAPPRLPVPEFPGAFAGKTVANESTGTICATSQTEALPEQVQAFYAGVLSADGWRTVIPPNQGMSRMAVYQKQERVCCVLAAQRPGGASRVTVLVNDGGL